MKKKILMLIALLGFFGFTIATSTFAGEKDILIAKQIKEADQLEKKGEDLADKSGAPEQKPATVNYTFRRSNGQTTKSHTFKFNDYHMCGSM